MLDEKIILVSNSFFRLKITQLAPDFNLITNRLTFYRISAA